ncbi:beta-ketoacyl-[acyl-carrier-protein] synthase family protein [Thermus sp.]|uniref:beta-ketoacyl-[acyl-carrier-protein] synthase family protein n=1 Tax=Thermus sp. TaxID=275 RepID=UPI002612B8C1|nr:beta-ketoacyl-[acyl-carrier-protein] synthase family protein [Thermus sp.]MCX7850263.1 beta-ketoacyl-[acyl-carrier-protein] synthase family protein [Thermus sp.]
MFVSGFGVVSPLGVGRAAFFQGLREGRVAIRRVDQDLDLPGIGAKVAAPCDGFDPLAFLPAKRVRRLGRTSQMAVAAAQLAVAEARLDPQRGTGAVVVGTGIGALEVLLENHQTFLSRGAERVSPFLVPLMMPNAPAAEISIELGIKGPSFGVVTACAASAHAVGLAFEMVRQGWVDWALAGGAEAVILPLVLAAFDRMGALSRNPDPQRASRPFDRDRDGFVLGEGAAVLVLESEEHLLGRGGQALAEVVGFGQSSDAFHITAPPEDGDGAYRAMAAALARAGLPPEAVDYVNAHGTSTPLNDRAETLALKRLLGERAYEVPVSSTKSQIGHLLGAAAAAELGAVLFAFLEGLIPATVTWENRDPECDLDYVPGSPRPGRVRVALKNSFGFGGQNASLVLRAV